MRKRLLILKLILLLLALNCLPVSGDVTLPIRFIALDVGEGQAILLQKGKQGVLIDTGHAGMARHVLDRLEAHGINRLDYIILTHLHPDHASGYFRIREAFPEATILDHHHPLPQKMPDMARWVAEALAHDNNRLVFHADDQINWQGTTLTALWPDNPHGSDMNANSLIIEISYGKHRALLMGDVNSQIEEQLLTTRSLKGPYDVLVAGHHGSQDTSSRKFLSQIQPLYSIISINADNIRGYPSAATLDRIRQYTKKELLITFLDGEACLEWQSGNDMAQKCSIPIQERK